MKLTIGCNERGQLAILEGSHYPENVVKGEITFPDVFLDDVLNPRQKHVLECRLGINGQAFHTQYELGGVVGVCRERVRQIEHAGLRRIILHPDNVEIVML